MKKISITQLVCDNQARCFNVRAQVYTTTLVFRNREDYEVPGIELRFSYKQGIYDPAF